MKKKSKPQRTSRRAAPPYSAQCTTAGDCYRTCIVCGEQIAWDSKSRLPPACGKHEYEAVFMAHDGVTSLVHLDALLACIPSTWCDPMLTGTQRVIGDPPYDCRDIDRVLLAIRYRVENHIKTNGRVVGGG